MKVKNISHHFASFAKTFASFAVKVFNYRKGREEKSKDAKGAKGKNQLAYSF